MLHRRSLLMFQIKSGTSVYFHTRKRCSSICLLHCSEIWDAELIDDQANKIISSDFSFPLGFWCAVDIQIHCEQRTNSSLSTSTINKQKNLSHTLKREYVNRKIKVFREVCLHSYRSMFGIVPWIYAVFDGGCKPSTRNASLWSTFVAIQQISSQLSSLLVCFIRVISRATKAERNFTRWQSVSTLPGSTPEHQIERNFSSACVCMIWHHEP